MARKFMMNRENISLVRTWLGKIRTTAQEIGNRALGGSHGRSDCLLCLETIRHVGLCQNCERLLARSGPACPRCAVPVGTQAWCGDCLRAPPAFDAVRTAFDYRFPLDRLVKRFKFSADLAAGAYLGEALGRAVARLPQPDLVVASPMSARRLRERGFNPALLLARRVATLHGIAFEARGLAKRRHTPTQTGLDAAARRRNLRGAFVVNGELGGLHVAVVDDVMTTGATLGALADVLKKAGAARVTGWVVARTPLPSREG